MQMSKSLMIYKSASHQWFTCRFIKQISTFSSVQ